MTTEAQRNALAHDVAVAKGKLRAACKDDDDDAIDVAVANYVTARLKWANSGGTLRRMSNALSLLSKATGGG
jgi:hypothetical protein